MFTHPRPRARDRPVPRVLVFPLGSGGGPGTVVSARTRLAEYASYCGEQGLSLQDLLER